MNKKFPLIIFDCDGVLVDSESISSRVLAEELRNLGLKLSNSEAIKLFTGGKLQDAFDYAAKILNKPIPSNIESIYREKTAEAFLRELKPVPGIAEVLEILPHPKCVASNGPKNKISSNLKITGLELFFKDKMFSAYDIQAWKPKPDLFLHAAEQMGYQPEDCIVIEDSPSGIQAGINAQMKVFAFLHNETDIKRFSDLGATPFNNMLDLPHLIGL